MSKYYCLISGLPAISLEDTKLTYSVADFKAEIDPVLSAGDRQLVRRFFLKFDNQNLLMLLHGGRGGRFDERGVFAEETLKEICESMKTEDRMPSGLSVPAYFETYIREYYTAVEEPSVPEHPALSEDKMSALYYNEAMACGNKFTASWFEFNLNINNVVTAINCRRHGLDKERFIIGDNDVARQLRSSGAHDFNMTDAADYLAEAVRISEEKDMLIREKRMDLLRWNRIEEQTVFRYFDVENVIACLLRIEMIERWVTLDNASGGATFRRLVHTMKNERAETWEKFKENNK
jgi:hypothetical protein